MKQVTINLPEFNLANWKTTLLGAAEAVAIGVITYLVSPNTELSVAGGLLAAVVALKGYISADYAKETPPVEPPK
jgi:hypothetical protein